MPASDPAAPRNRFRLIVSPILAGLLHAGLMAAAFPPFDFWPCVVVAPLPLIWVALNRARDPQIQGERRLSRIRARVRRGLALWALVSLGVLPFDLYEQQWVMAVSGLGFIPMAAILAGFAGIFVIAVRQVRRRWPRMPLALAVPLLWVALEVLRGEVAFTGYPWYLLAHPLIAIPALAVPAGLIGTYGVSAEVALLAGAAADTLASRRRRWIVISVAGAVVVLIGLAAALLAPLDTETGTVRIAVIQTNIPQDNKNEWTMQARLRDFDRFLELTLQAARAIPEPGLIVWPETMFPGPFLDPAAIAEVRLAEARLGRTFDVFTVFPRELEARQRALGVPMLIGAMGVDNLRITGTPEQPRLDYDAQYNSVFLVQDGTVDPDRYDKIVLTPFGEVMPYIRLWPWLQRTMLRLGANGMTFDLGEGTRPRVFQTRGGAVSIVTPICFEATKPSLCRKLIRATGTAPRVMVNLTNDGWFGPFDRTRWQHLQIARWRAVELNIPVVRSANTGVSCLIDSRGRLVKSGIDGSANQARLDGVLTVDVHPAREPTIYSRTGDVVGWSVMTLAGVLILVSVIPRRQENAA